MIGPLPSRANPPGAEKPALVKKIYAASNKYYNFFDLFAYCIYRQALIPFNNGIRLRRPHFKKKGGIRRKIPP
ncbi:MAG: hypothetical protein B6I22_05875 [Desulfobacteraceae bacterium 4572_123]|nr:MAG: hypothetical protein B6I22_05875 [Desulfobacteraceae bacterium 4572_123]